MESRVVGGKVQTGPGGVSRGARSTRRTRHLHPDGGAGINSSHRMDWAPWSRWRRTHSPRRPRKKRLSGFRAYEDIHPFADGNRRTGSILYNWLCGSLPEPIDPPNLWNDPYPEYPPPIL
jgi:hypothetical protein